MKAKTVWITAKDKNTELLDMHKLTKELLIDLGEEASKSLFMIADSAVWENYPNGINDNTHFNVKGALEIARIPKFRPRTKHMNNRIHHFRSYVDITKEITIHKIATEDQPADFLTKPVNEELNAKHRKFVLGW